MLRPEDDAILSLKKTLVKLDQRCQILCKTKKSLYPALSPNGLSEHTNLGGKKQVLYLDSVGV